MFTLANVYIIDHKSIGNLLMNIRKIDDTQYKS